MLEFLIRIANAEVGCGSKITNFIENPLQVETIQELFCGLYKYAFAFGSIAAVALTMWGAFQILMSGGNAGKRSEGLSTIKWVAIGYALLILSGGITGLVSSILGGTKEISMWSCFGGTTSSAPPPSPFRQTIDPATGQYREINPRYGQMPSPF